MFRLFRAGLLLMLVLAASASRADPQKPPDDEPQPATADRLRALPAAKNLVRIPLQPDLEITALSRETSDTMVRYVVTVTNVGTVPTSGLRVRTDDEDPMLGTFGIEVTLKYLYRDNDHRFESRSTQVQTIRALAAGESVTTVFDFWKSVPGPLGTRLGASFVFFVVDRTDRVKNEIVEGDEEHSNNYHANTWNLSL